MAYKFRGTTIAFGSTVARLVGLSYADTGEQIDITNTASTRKEFETDLQDQEVVADVIGSTTLTTQTAAAATTITWTDGGSLSLGNCVITNVRTSGQMGAAIKSSITFKPTT